MLNISCVQLTVSSTINKMIIQYHKISMNCVSNHKDIYIQNPKEYMPLIHKEKIRQTYIVHRYKHVQRIKCYFDVACH